MNAADRLVRTTPAGALRGVPEGAKGQVTAFRGIPYATAPRFAAPEPAPTWQGIRDATHAGPAAPQPPSRLTPVMGPSDALPQSEDCLTLNVWTPSTAGSSADAAGAEASAEVGPGAGAGEPGGGPGEGAGLGGTGAGVATGSGGEVGARAGAGEASGGPGGAGPGVGGGSGAGGAEADGGSGGDEAEGGPGGADGPGEGLLPVLVWLHGGGFSSGSGGEGFYDGGLLAERGRMVVVTVNYRLGAFGYLYLGPGFGPANPGLLDQLAALRWVRDTIEVFGGDPARVTLAGQSAGALSALALLAHPAGRGLFHQAVLESTPAGVAPHSPAEATANARRLAELLGLSPTQPPPVDPAEMAHPAEAANRRASQAAGPTTPGPRRAPGPTASGPGRHVDSTGSGPRRDAGPAAPGPGRDADPTAPAPRPDPGSTGPGPRPDAGPTSAAPQRDSGPTASRPGRDPGPAAPGSGRNADPTTPGSRRDAGPTNPAPRPDPGSVDPGRGRDAGPAAPGPGRDGGPTGPGSRWDGGGAPAHRWEAPRSSEAFTPRAAESGAAPEADARGLVASLRAVAVPTLLDAQQALSRERSAPLSVTPPLQLVAAEGLPADLLRTARADVPLLIGTAREEARAFFPDEPDGVLAEVTEERFAEPSGQLAARAADAYAYRFDWAPQGSPLGACHCIELPFVFGAGGDAPGGGEGDAAREGAWAAAPMLVGAAPEDLRRLTAEVQSAWASFVHTGTPGWAPYPQVKHIR